MFTFSASHNAFVPLTLVLFSAHLMDNTSVSSIKTILWVINYLRVRLRSSLVRVVFIFNPSLKSVIPAAPMWFSIHLKEMKKRWKNLSCHLLKPLRSSILSVELAINSLLTTRLPFFWLPLSFIYHSKMTSADAESWKQLNPLTFQFHRLIRSDENGKGKTFHGSTEFQKSCTRSILVYLSHQNILSE